MPELISNLFSGEAWSMMTMTQAINTMPFVPGRIGQMGLFEAAGVATNHIQIEEENGVLSLIPSKARGEAPTQNAHGKRKMRYLGIPHFPLADTLMATEVQGVRVLGGTELQGWEAERDKRLASMAAKHDATLEYGKLGAIKGRVLDADGVTVLYDLFAEFGVNQTTVDFLFGTTTGSGRLKKLVLGIKRTIEGALQNGVYSQIRAVCGKNWFDAFTTHPEVVDAYNLWLDGQYKRDDQRKGFEIWGVVFEEYVGAIGGTPFVADAECHFFPTGVNGLYKTWFGPGNFLESANTIGLPRYAKSEPMKWNRGVELLTESNPIHLCTKPSVLVKGTSSTF